MGRLLVTRTPIIDAFSIDSMGDGVEFLHEAPVFYQFRDGSTRDWKLRRDPQMQSTTR